MPILNRNVACLLLASALVACDSDTKPAKELDAGAEEEPESEPGEGDEPDATDTTSESDAGTEPSAAVPLTVWVDDLIDHRTTDEAEPDTVDDKVIRDDTDESSFDKYLP